MLLFHERIIFNRADYYSIPEDMATSSANGCLKYQYFKKSEVTIREEQGYEIERPLYCFIKKLKITINSIFM
jgi:predicted PhzF superfamily epimerase YddE/YHI9